MLALTVVAAAAATRPAQPLLEMDGSANDPPATPKGLPPAASDAPPLSLRGRSLTITAGADACTGMSAGLPAAECSAWQDLYNKTGGTVISVVQNATVSVIEQCALSHLSG
jgi:hypothetical protein